MICDFVVYLFSIFVSEDIMAKEYKAKDITILEGLDAVRMRPGM